MFFKVAHEKECNIKSFSCAFIVLMSLKGDVCNFCKNIMVSKIKLTHLLIAIIIMP